MTMQVRVDTGGGDDGKPKGLRENVASPEEAGAGGAHVRCGQASEIKFAHILDPGRFFVATGFLLPENSQ